MAATFHSNEVELFKRITAGFPLNLDSVFYCLRFIVNETDWTPLVDGPTFACILL